VPERPESRSRRRQPGARGGRGALELIKRLLIVKGYGARIRNRGKMRDITLSDFEVFIPPYTSGC
jgi:hypothetical protein